MANHVFEQRLQAGLKDLERNQQRRLRRCTEFLSTTACTIAGFNCISFATNDYLGLTRHPRVLEAFAAAAAEQYGAGASALIAGRSPWHVSLEESIAHFESTESALLFPSGFAANTGTLTALVRSADAVFCDRENHASLIDGCRASAGRFLVYDHADLDRLSDALRRRQNFETTFIVTDSVFSMDGRLADLPRLCEIAEHHRAVLIVDEAHGTGVFGVGGRGVCELQHVEDRVPVRIGTLSKAIGGMGGFVAGAADLCEWLWNSARSQFFSTALPPASCAAAAEAIRVIMEEPQRRQTLAARAEFARAELRQAGLEVMAAPLESPIIAVLLADDNLAVRVSQRMLEQGFFIPAVRPPTVAAGSSRLRFSVCCDHSEQQIRDAACHLRDVVRSDRR